MRINVRWIIRFYERELENNKFYFHSFFCCRFARLKNKFTIKPYLLYNSSEIMWWHSHGRFFPHWSLVLYCFVLKQNRFDKWHALFHSVFNYLAVNDSLKISLQLFYFPLNWIVCIALGLWNFWKFKKKNQIGQRRGNKLIVEITFTFFVVFTNTLGRFLMNFEFQNDKFDL